jgi:hypothetical protein
MQEVPSAYFAKQSQNSLRTTQRIKEEYLGFIDQN